MTAAAVIAAAAPAPAARPPAPSPIPVCAYGAGVRGLQGYLAPAVTTAASHYAAGLASATSAQRAQARSAFAAAAAAYVYGLPQISVRSTVTHLPRSAMVSVNALADPSVRTVVSPNVDTAYTVSWLDLVSGPLVVNVPDTGGRYYTFQFLDAFSNAFAYVGSGSTGTAAGAYAIVPPGWSGVLPPGVTRVQAPSNTVWLLGRTLVKGPGDLPAVKAIQQQYSVTPLAAWTLGIRQPPVVLSSYPPTIPRSVPTGQDFISTLNQEMTIDPPPAADDCALAAMAAASVVIPHPTPADTAAADAANLAGQPPVSTPGPRDPISAPAIDAGVAAGARILGAVSARLRAVTARADHGWSELGPWVGRFGTRFLARAVVARDLLAANTPAQAIYPIATTDSARRPLTGARQYTIRFPRQGRPPVRAFWSVTLYGADDFLVTNPISRYAIGDRTPGLRRNRDGSLTLYVQHAAPSNARARANWLPAPSGAFHLVMRLYEPKPAAQRGRWKPPYVVAVSPRRRSPHRALRRPPRRP